VGQTVTPCRFSGGGFLEAKRENPVTVFLRGNNMNTDTQIERRVLDTGPIEIRNAGDPGGKVTIYGYAAVFNRLSAPMSGFREVIAPGAFDGCLCDDIRALFNHDNNVVLGRTSSNTLRITQDATGLRYEVDLPDTHAARDLATSIARGDVSQSSFAFSLAPKGDRWEKNGEGVQVRTITKVARLYDVSPVTYPAYPDATVAMRSLEHWNATHTPAPDDDALNWQSAARARELALLEM